MYTSTHIYSYSCPGCLNSLMGIYRQFGYVPFGVLDTSSTGRQTREGSRTLEVSI